MVEIQPWMEQYLNALDNTFGQRIQFVGLQGSYGRGEATETSDIDVVLILDQVTGADIRVYGEMLDTLPQRDKICGFVSGKTEIMAWEASDLFQFYHDTTPARGSLDELLPLLDADAVNRAIKIGACNIYHGCVHNMLHEKSTEILQGLYKAAAYVVQAIYYQQTGCYIRQQEVLMGKVAPEEREILAGNARMKSGKECPFQQLSEQLHVWAAHWIART